MTSVSTLAEFSCDITCEHVLGFLSCNAGDSKTPFTRHNRLYRVNGVEQSLSQYTIDRLKARCLMSLRRRSSFDCSVVVALVCCGVNHHTTVDAALRSAFTHLCCQLRIATFYSRPRSRQRQRRLFYFGRVIYDRPVQQMRTLYFHPVVSSIFFLLLFFLA